MKEKDDNKKGRRGLPKGRTNNPNGRPKGAANKVQASLKKRIVDYLEEDFDNFILEIKRLKGPYRVKAKLEMMKLVIPRPVSQEELDAIAATGSPLISRLFGKEKEE